MSTTLSECSENSSILTARDSGVLKWATTDKDWEGQRSLIRHLYLEEGRTLNEVMSIMERDHNFKATVKMYKNRITKWGLDKKSKEREMKAIARIKTTRAASGKKSEFQLRGRRVNLKEVDRYLKRKSLKVENIVMEAGPPASTLPTLECLTPKHIPSSPSTPRALEIPEYIFSSIRDYFLGSFGAGTWVTKSDVIDCFSTKPQGNEMLALKGLFSHHEVACRLLEKRSFEEAGRVLVNATANIENILTAEHPRTLGALFDFIMFLRGKKRSEIAVMLLRQFAAMALVVLPATHPLGQICKSLTSLDSGEFESVIITAWQSALDRLDSTIGPMHYSALRSRLEYIQMVESIHGLERAEAALRKLVARCKTSCGLVDSRTLKLLDTLGEILMDQQKYDEAEEVAWDIVIYAPRVQPLAKAVDLCVAGLFINARVHHIRQAKDLAEEALQRAINMNMSVYGWNHALTLKYLVYMEEWQTEWGNCTLAAQIKDKRLQIMNSEDALL